MTATSRLAVYTTVYPGVERFLPEWLASVRSQTDTGFDIWMGVDALGPREVRAALGGGANEIEMVCFEGKTPAAVRQQVLARLTKEYWAVVLTDSDDVLFPTRVEAARKQLAHCDLTGCALRILDGAGRDTGLCFGPEQGEDPVSSLFRYNVFGFSNTAYRSELLKRCLPLPDDCELMDWLLATRAWSMGARIHFDRVERMGYRQYGENTARVAGAFTARDICRATERVLRHYEHLLSAGGEFARPDVDRLNAARNRVRTFHAAITESETKLASYVTALNGLPRKYVWWWCVANPDLEEIWKQ